MSKTDKPVIVVTGPDKFFPFGWWATRFILHKVGAVAHYVTPKKPTLPLVVHGIVIGGGDDIEPSHYGLLGDADSVYDPERDALEIQVLKQAISLNIPVLGICRGAQLINVVAGGSLHSDIRPLRLHTPNQNSIFPVKTVSIDIDSKVYQILNKKEVRVNSLHKQAVDRMAESLKATAYDEDGFVQAIEDPKKAYFVGVQWHPEYMPYRLEQRKLFKALVNSAKKAKSFLDTSALTRE